MGTFLNRCHFVNEYLLKHFLGHWCLWSLKENIYEGDLGLASETIFIFLHLCFSLVHTNVRGLLPKQTNGQLSQPHTPSLVPRISVICLTSLPPSGSITLYSLALISLTILKITSRRLWIIVESTSKFDSIFITVLTFCSLSFILFTVVFLSR
jgi:hypothetical protein